MFRADLLVQIHRFIASSEFDNAKLSPQSQSPNKDAPDSITCASFAKRGILILISVDQA